LIGFFYSTEPVTIAAPKIMTTPQCFEQSIAIRTHSTTVERCFTDLTLMNSWLNPILRCEALPNTAWSTKLGAKSQFAIQIPILKPVLISTIVERAPGLIVWEFSGFFRGRDRWEVQPQDIGSLLLNRFEFTIPNPIIAFGFNTFAATWTKADMTAQLQRLKQVAERL
jgi:Polyketide cyclase / dehydrase and lipid transport